MQNYHQKSMENKLHFTYQNQDNSTISPMPRDFQKMSQFNLHQHTVASGYMTAR